MCRQIYYNPSKNVHYTIYNYLYSKYSFYWLLVYKWMQIIDKNNII